MKKLISLLIIISALLSGCGQNTASYTQTGFYFDTVITVCFYGSEAKNATQKCMEMASYHDSLWNKNNHDSDVSRINNSNGEPITVSPETIALLKTALMFSEISSALTTPAIGSVSSLWDFKAETPALPDDYALTEALNHIDYRNIIISDNTVSLSDDQLQIDLGYIAKGYSADLMKETVLSMGVSSGWINLGGNVLTIGSKPNKEAFNIGIKNPLSEEESLMTLPIMDNSVVTSGTYERCFTLNDVLYFHILDTKTGYPVRNNLLSVSVIGPSSAYCDALSTTLFVMGYEEGTSFLHSFDGYEAIFVTDKGEILKSD